MAAVPAYRYDSMAAQPARRTAPDVRVVPGRKRSSNPVISDFAVTVIHVVVACLVVFLIVGFVRVGLASMAYSTASASSDLRASVEDARTTGESLAVQESLLASSSNIRTEAEALGMVEGTATSTMTLSADPVSIDSAGNLSFAGSMSRIASQG